MRPNYGLKFKTADSKVPGNVPVRFELFLGVVRTATFSSIVSVFIFKVFFLTVNIVRIRPAETLAANLPFFWYFLLVSETATV